MLIYWASDLYSITLWGHVLVHFFPDSFYKLLHMPGRLAEGMAFHFLFAWIFALNGFVYVLYLIISREWKQLLPNRHSFKEAWLVVLHDLHIRKTAPLQDKYNAAQRVAYSGIIVMGFGSLVTGLAIYKPVQFNWLCWLCGGYHLARIWHFVLTIGYVFFFLIHITQVILAGWNNFRSVVSGFEVLNEHEPVIEPVIPSVVDPGAGPAIVPLAAPEEASPTAPEAASLTAPEAAPPAAPEIDNTPDDGKK